MVAYVEAPQQEESGLQAHGEDEPQDSGGDEHPDAMGLRQDDDNGQRD